MLKKIKTNNMTLEIQKIEAETGEVLNIPETPQFYPQPSALKITEDEQRNLMEDFDEKQVQIRPDGLIYLPQVFWRERLNKVFGIGQWCLLVKATHKDEREKSDKLYLQGVLIVRGCYMAEAVGEAELHTDNPMQSWASVWEAAKSDCITRCCKDLSIASKLWQPEFIQSWVGKYAVRVWRNKTGKHKTGNGWETGSYQWRKKEAERFYDESTGNNAPVPKPPQDDISKVISKSAPPNNTSPEVQQGVANMLSQITDEIEGRKALALAAKDGMEALVATWNRLAPVIKPPLENHKNTLKKEIEQAAK